MPETGRLGSHCGSALHAAGIVHAAPAVDDHQAQAVDCDDQSGPGRAVEGARCRVAILGYEQSGLSPERIRPSILEAAMNIRRVAIFAARAKNRVLRQVPWAAGLAALAVALLGGPAAAQVTVQDIGSATATTPWGYATNPQTISQSFTVTGGNAIVVELSDHKPTMPPPCRRRSPGAASPSPKPSALPPCRVPIASRPSTGR